MTIDKTYEGERMQIVIPMSGFGERFRRAGYSVPKPLIEVDGVPIIGHVINLFPNETDFTFICNEDHLASPQYQLRERLVSLCPTGRIVGIPAHKLGPVHAVRQVEHLLDPARPVIVNYCDFSCYWDWNAFKNYVSELGCDGAIPAYKGFHPHSLGTTNYAYLRETFGWVDDIQEKQPFTNNRMEEFASSGTYYFASARLMSDAFKRTVEGNLSVGGEFYVSLAYKVLLADKKAVVVYPIQHFMQWGTPEDLVEYSAWSATFKRLINPAKYDSPPAGSAVIPMAGLGSRFAKEGYSQSKPLIPVSGRPMVVQATRDLPFAKQNVFVLRSDMPNYESVIKQIQTEWPNALIKNINFLTEGQACTAQIGLDALLAESGEVLNPLTIGACDNGVIYNHERLSSLINDDSVGVIVWGIRGYVNAIRHPTMYGWIDTDNDVIRRVSVKTALSNPHTDPIVIGCFTFLRAEDFKRALDRLIARDGRVNGEFYIDSLINDAIALGISCRLFEVDSFLCWGTPNDLRTFEYWQSCFHKWNSHPYRLERDDHVPTDQVCDLDIKYQATTPTLPERRP